jgi:hypothetical protein
MNSIAALCTPRKSVFDPSHRDSVLDLSDALQDRIRPREFFEENYPTEGMRHLIQEAFRRFERQPGSHGVFVLTQAMGGGKTHTMIALSLLAKHPELRSEVMRGGSAMSGLGRVRVVGFTGRESDAPLGIWGSIAEQLGKREAFKDYYAPLQAPGQTAWINLLRGEPLLILLDELPPYFENARSRAIGNSDLATVTTTALSNLLAAVGKQELENVCVVISDLTATYEGGSQQILRALSNFEHEANRGAVRLEPVGANTDEVYQILRRRLFEGAPSSEQVLEVAKAYAQAVHDAKQMDITNASPEQFARQIQESYPFHFSIRDLYARFRENSGFQQTRGLIRLMRTVVARLYESGRASEVQLIHPYDFDLNDPQTLAEVTLINPKLANAVSHDVASHGQAIAETIDANTGGGSDAQDASKLLLIASLGDVQHAVLGLSLAELISNLCAPGRDVSRLLDTVLKPLATSAWYLHTNAEGKLYFRDVQNLVAKLHSTALAYNRESALKELRDFLKKKFEPEMNDCYQEVIALPAVDQIQIRSDRLTLVVYEPHDSGGLHPDLKALYENLDYKNRILFLSGPRGTLQRLVDNAAQLKAIRAILAEMDAEKVPERDPQRVAALDLRDKIDFQLLSTARETFTTLYFPHMSGLLQADFLMQFNDNKYHGEAQVRETLAAKQKFTTDVESAVFRQKCEQRLFTQQQMPWGEVRSRAARDIRWQWHRPDALDALKANLIGKDQWREEGGYVDKGPFPQPCTDVRWQELQRDDNTGKVVLRLTAVHGDTVHYEIGGPATTISMVVPDPRSFETDELQLSFLCVDSSRTHETGPPALWRNRIVIKSRIFEGGGGKMVELQVAPSAPIRYTTDGSNPRVSGGIYDGPFSIPRGTKYVIAVAESSGITSDEHRLPVNWNNEERFKLDTAKPVVWKREHKLGTTREAYELLERMKKYDASVRSPHATVHGDHWLDLSFDERLEIKADRLEIAIEHLRGLIGEGQVALGAPVLVFPSGQHLLNWVAEVRTELKPGEVEQ